MQLYKLYNKVLDNAIITANEGLMLYNNAPLADLMYLGNSLRQLRVPGNKVTWLIDRNVNITNVCISRCKFCNFHRIPGHGEAYITTIDEYREKINGLFQLGGDQLLLQGGLHPKLGLAFYKELFEKLKAEFPKLKLHALGPAEIAHIAKMEKQSYTNVLKSLVESGLDSLPGAGAEILCDRVRKFVSPGKCSSSEWLNVMREAHKLNLPTSATMMFGHAETIEERLEHLVSIRQVQSEKPQGHHGFIAFIPWPFQDADTVLQRKLGITNEVSGTEYLRMIALSRIMLHNINNIQASWLTVGPKTGQLALHAGANDFGSVMIEENVVSSAGANFQLDVEGMCNAIKQAGFEPLRRDQRYQKYSL